MKITTSLLKMCYAVIAVMILEGIFFVTPFSMAMVKTVEPPRAMMAGVASYYSYECANQPMANGKLFDPQKRTCASWFHPFGTVLIVKCVETGLSTEVAVTDRGPNKRLVQEGRIIDLSERAFRDICDTDKGLTTVEITVKSRQKII